MRSNCIYFIISEQIKNCNLTLQRMEMLACVIRRNIIKSLNIVDLRKLADK